MFNKFELIGAAASIGVMVLALYLVQVRDTLPNLAKHNQPAQVATQAGIITVGEGEETQARTEAFTQAMDEQGNIQNMVIDDVKIGTGEPVKAGDTVSVHYIGTLQDGQEFDNSKKRGQPFEFTVGDGQVIKGWDEGLIGMKVGGQRMLVIPPEMGYGDTPIGPIPANSTLIFAIELLGIK